MVLLNKSAQTICCTVNETLQLTLYPYENKVVEITVTDTTKLQLAHTYCSCYGECFNLNNVCQIVLNTTFIFTNLSVDSVICISREKVHFALGYTYDRFFCSCSDARIIQEIHNVVGLDDLYAVASNINTKNEVQDSLLGFIFEGHLWQTTALFILFKLIFWANNWKFPWWLIFIFWGAGYLLRFMGEKSFNTFQKKIGTQEYHLLRKYISCDYIQQYYTNPQRKWIANDIENE